MNKKEKYVSLTEKLQTEIISKIIRKALRILNTAADDENNKRTICSHLYIEKWDLQKVFEKLFFNNEEEVQILHLLSPPSLFPLPLPFQRLLK